MFRNYATSWLPAPLLVILVTGLPSIAHGTTLLVPSQYATIQAAVNAGTSPGDTILVSPGFYAESVTIQDQVLHIIGTGGSGTTSVSSIAWTNPSELEPCGGTLQGFQILDPFQFVFEEVDSFLRDLVFESNAAISRELQDANLTIQECVFLGNLNLGTSFSAPVLVRLEDSVFPNATMCTLNTDNLEAERCRWVGTTVTAHGESDHCTIDDCTFESGATLRPSSDGTVTVSNCTFDGIGTGSAIDMAWSVNGLFITNNVINGYASGVSSDEIFGSAYLSGNVIENCSVGIASSHVVTMQDNVLMGCGTGVSTELIDGDITGNTIVGCSGAAIDAATVTGSGAGAVIANNLIAGNGAGWVIGSVDAIDLISCNDVWNNTGGNWSGIADPTGIDGNISIDPRFCDSGTVDGLGLDPDSPCAPGNHPDGFACGQIGARGVECLSEYPRILSVTDVGNDQGRQVRLRWVRSRHDAAGGDPAIVQYGIYRRQDLFRARPADPELPPAVHAIDGWDYIASVPARGDSIYQAIAPTLCDSTASGGVCWSAFFVSAMAAVPTVYFDSPPDSGYSVDNLAPAVPEGIAWSYPSLVHWNQAVDEDFQYFTVYGGPTTKFAGAEPLGQVVDPAFDADGSIHAHYFVTATDFAGNESGPGGPLDTPSGAPSIELPATLTLHPVHPHPARATSVVRFDLPLPAHITLEVFDVAGRRIAAVSDGWREAGRHEVAWSEVVRSAAGSVRTGVYYLRLRTEDGEVHTRVIVLD